MARPDGVHRGVQGPGRGPPPGAAAHPPPPAITLRTERRRGHRIAIIIKDRGVGIDSTDRSRMFDPYFTTKRGGTGLGLAIANELVRAHGGTIRLVESVSGRTVFSITIPDRPVRLDEVRQGLRRPAEAKG